MRIVRVRIVLGTNGWDPAFETPLGAPLCSKCNQQRYIILVIRLVIIMVIILVSSLLVSRGVSGTRVTVNLTSWQLWRNRVGRRLIQDRFLAFVSERSYRLKGDCPNGLATDTDKAGVLARLAGGDAPGIGVSADRVIFPWSLPAGSFAPRRPSASSQARVGSERSRRLAAAFIAACLSVGIS